jgi:hypothetical protein
MRIFPQPLAARFLRSSLAATGLALGALVTLGFGLDRGELKCEQGAAYLAECCPELDIGRMNCGQEGGCDREAEGTILAEEESECIRESPCGDIRARDVCGRLEVRIARTHDAEEMPTMQELYEEDWLCD